MEDLFLGVLAVIDFHNKIQVVYSMINTARSEPLKRVGTLFLIWLLVATLTTSPVQAQPASPFVADTVAQAKIQTLWEQATQQKRDGKIEAVIETVQEIITVERSMYGRSHPQLTITLDLLAQLQEGKDDFAAAESTRNQILAIHSQVFGDKGWRTIDAQLELKGLRLRQKMSPEQRSQLSTARQLHQTSLTLEQQGKLREALVSCEQSLELFTRVAGKQHAQTAASINNLAKLYVKLGKYAEAEPLFRQSLEIHIAVLGEHHPSTAAILNNLAFLLERQARFVDAEPMHLRSLEITRNTLGEQHPDTATCFGNLAILYNSLGEYEKAETLHRQALDIRKSTLGEEHPDYTTSLNNMGTLYSARGDFAKAEPLYRQALDIQKRTLGEEHPDYAASLENLGELYRAMGDYAKAEPLYVQALDIRKRILGEEHSDYANSLNNLGVLYVSMADFAKAEPLFRQSLDIRKKVLGEEHPDYASSLNNLAVLYADMGDSTRAEPLYRQSQDIRKRVLGEEHPDYATSLNNLAALYTEMGDATRAEPLYRQSLDIRKKVLGEEHPDYASSLNALGLLYSEMGDATRAEPLYRQSQDIWKRVLGEEHPDYATSLNNLGLLYSSMSDSTRAEPLFRQALDIWKKVFGEEHSAYAVSLNNLGLLYSEMGDSARAEPLLRRALHSTRTSLEATTIIQSERQQLAMGQGLRYHLDGYLSLATASKQFDEQAFREVLSWKGATLVRQRQMRKVGENIDVAPLFKELQETATRLATLSRLDTEPEKQVAWRRQITDLTAEKERLEAELSLKSSEFREAQKEVSLEDLLTSLPDNAALVDFLEYQRLVPPQEAKSRPQSIRSLVAFVVRRNMPIKLLDLGPVAPLSEAIDVWRTTFGISREGAAAGRLLRETIWVPVETHLDGADLILVSVDGALGRLPLAALPGREPGTFLLEDHRLAMLPVPQLLPALVSDLGRRELSGGLLLMGDVNYDAESDTAPAEPNQKSWKRSSTSLVRGDSQFSPLAATAGEIASIKELFTDLFHPEPNALKTLKQAAATEQEFRESASKFYNLHLATHGFFAAAEKKSALASDSSRSETQMLSSDRDQMIRGFNPGLLSGLAFSGANRKPEVDKDDGILTADEIATLSLDGVDLVVLSACETGLGEVAGGEGLLGVQRAFQVAGARTTVASLWQVGDVATRRLMEHFYRDYWQKDLSKLDALRDAQLYLLNHPEAIRGDRRLQPGDISEPKRLSPEFWAAFVLSGDWR